MVGDGLVGEPQFLCPLDARLLQQKRRYPLVQALPHDLLDEPHDLRKAGGHQFVGVVGHRRRLLHDPPVYLRRDDPEVRVLLCLNGHLKLDGPHDAGGGEQAHIHIEQPVEGDLTPLLREHIGPQLSGLDQKQAGTVHAPVVEHRPLFYRPGDQTVQQAVLLLFCQFIPYREHGLKLHRAASLPCSRPVYCDAWYLSNQSEQDAEKTGLPARFG